MIYYDDTDTQPHHQCGAEMARWKERERMRINLKIRNK